MGKGRGEGKGGLARDPRILTGGWQEEKSEFKFVIIAVPMQKSGVWPLLGPCRQ